MRQGYVLSPLLFNIYSEATFKEALDETSGGIRVNGVVIYNLRYADDTVILANNPAELQRMIDSVVQYNEQFGLHMNISRTNVMVFSKIPRIATIKINKKQSIRWLPLDIWEPKKR